MKRKYASPVDRAELLCEDLECAMQIAAYAGLNTRDRRGNLLPEVWVRQADRMSSAQLLADTDIRSLLVEYLKTEFRGCLPGPANTEAAHDAVDTDQQEALMRDQRVRWVLDTVRAWELAYHRLVNRNFDISQKILSAMSDTFYETEGALLAAGIDIDGMRDRIQALHDTDAKKYLSGDNGVMRFFFRHPATKAQFRRAAGRFLQKSEVCNKAGAYSAKVQRNDVTQQRDNALHDLVVYLEFEGRLQGRLSEIKECIAAQLDDWVMDPKYIEFEEAVEDVSSSILPVLSTEAVGFRSTSTQAASDAGGALEIVHESRGGMSRVGSRVDIIERQGQDSDGTDSDESA